MYRIGQFSVERFAALDLWSDNRECIQEVMKVATYLCAIGLYAARVRGEVLGDKQ